MLGSRVRHASGEGTVRFKGTTSFAVGQWVGVELDSQNGKVGLLLPPGLLTREHRTTVAWQARDTSTARWGEGSSVNPLPSLPSRPRAYVAASLYVVLTGSLACPIKRTHLDDNLPPLLPCLPASGSDHQPFPSHLRNVFQLVDCPTSYSAEISRTCAVCSPRRGDGGVTHVARKETIRGTSYGTGAGVQPGAAGGDCAPSPGA